MRTNILCVFILIFINVAQAQFSLGFGVGNGISFGVGFMVPIGQNNLNISYDCPTNVEKSLKLMEKGFDNINSNIDISIMCFKGAIYNDSLFCDAYDYMAYCYRLKKQPDSALNYINKSLKINNTNIWARKTKGHILFYDLKDYNKSADYYYQESLKQKFEAYWLYNLSESLIKLEMFDSAQVITNRMKIVLEEQEKKVLQNTLKIKPFKLQPLQTEIESTDGWNSHALYLFLQGKMAFKQKNYVAADRAFNSIKQEFRMIPEFCYMYGMSLLNKNEPEEKTARKYLKKAEEYGFVLDE